MRNHLHKYFFDTSPDESVNNYGKIHGERFNGMLNFTTLVRLKKFEVYPSG